MIIDPRRSPPASRIYGVRPGPCDGCGTTKEHRAAWLMPAGVDDHADRTATGSLLVSACEECGEDFARAQVVARRYATATATVRAAVKCRRAA